MRYLTLAEALTIAEAVTGTSAAVLARASRLDLLDSALHAPRPGSVTSSSTPTSPDFADKAAVLVVRVAKNRLIVSIFAGRQGVVSFGSGRGFMGLHHVNHHQNRQNQCL